MESKNNKDIANSLNTYTNNLHIGTNFVLNSVDNIDKWYEKQITEFTNIEDITIRLETNVNNDLEENTQDEKKYSKIETKVSKYDEIQMKNNINHKIKQNKIKTFKNEKKDNTKEKYQFKEVRTRKTRKIIKGLKILNNTANRFIATGKSINTSINEEGSVAFKNTSSRIMTKPVKRVMRKVNKKLKKTIPKRGKKALKSTGNLIKKTTKLVTKAVTDTINMILSMLPSTAPILIILIAIVGFCNFFRNRNERRCNAKI